MATVYCGKALETNMIGYIYNLFFFQSVLQRHWFIKDDIFFFCEFILIKLALARVASADVRRKKNLLSPVGNIVGT